jgi:hypothetical protein
VARVCKSQTHKYPDVANGKDKSLVGDMQAVKVPGSRVDAVRDLERSRVRSVRQYR